MPNDYSDMNVHRHDNNNIITGANVPVKEWTVDVPVEEGARKQLFNIAKMPFVFKHVAAMPDVHWGLGATVGSVICTQKAIIPAAVGVDIGCGMMAVQTTLKADHLPDNIKAVRSAIEKAVPHGRTDNGGKNDRGAWGKIPSTVEIAWMGLEGGYKKLVDKNKKLGSRHGQDPHKQLGTLGGGNHFVEVCIDEAGSVWIMLHSGSRGVGNRIGSYFIETAKKEMEKWFINGSLPDINLSYLPEGSDHFQEYVEAVGWAQDFARENREQMMANVIKALKKTKGIPKFEVLDEAAVNCHHNYVEKEFHYGKNVWVTRKGAIRARDGDLGIIPGSMGARSFIVRGKGCKESFCSASHGAGRVMSRKKASETITTEQHKQDTEGVECRKDRSVIDESPRAYKDIDKVMAAQSDLVEVVHTLKQVVCIKG